MAVAHNTQKSPINLQGVADGSESSDIRVLLALYRREKLCPFQGNIWHTLLLKTSLTPNIAAIGK